MCVDKYLHKLNVKTWPKGMQLFRIVQKGLENTKFISFKNEFEKCYKKKTEGQGHLIYKSKEIITKRCQVKVILKKYSMNLRIFL